ncbi:MAG: HAD family phosphatase [Paludibacter sp.]|nr:HAD family phosphatase [Bacteroidales bacterium]MCM1069617.1 HAD family phosphatase [Prevotella sp.]MCM1354263.1 HAD family phosphatase [Bacteroides sp.]MCM1443102.1 HAD family phosphatase [Muribaculum sp.]MCM1482337.1 HAD family phosphatase [Paludibacter sp.]
MIRNLIFDIGGVLIDLEPQRTLQALGRLSAQPIGQFSDKELLGGGGSDLVGKYMCGNITNEDFFGALQQLSHPEVTIDQLQEAWNSMLLGLPQQRVNIIRTLHQQGIRIALLSNINDAHLQRTRQLFAEADLQIGRDIDYAFFSNEMHLAKPDASIYREVLNQTGFVPEDTLYIDDLEENIRAGATFGLHTLQAVGDEWIDPVMRSTAVPT